MFTLYPVFTCSAERSLPLWGNRSTRIALNVKLYLNSVPLISKQRSFYPLCIYKQYANRICTWKQLRIFVLSLLNIFQKGFTYSLRRLSRPQPNSLRIEAATPAVSKCTTDSMDRFVLEWILYNDVSLICFSVDWEEIGLPRILRQVIDHTCTLITLLSWAHLKRGDEKILDLRAECIKETESIHHYRLRLTYTSKANVLSWFCVHTILVIGHSSFLVEMTRWWINDENIFIYGWTIHIFKIMFMRVTTFLSTFCTSAPWHFFDQSKALLNPSVFSFGFFKGQEPINNKSFPVSEEVTSVQLQIQWVLSRETKTAFCLFIYFIT